MSKRKRRDDALSSLNAAIDALDPARGTTGAKPAKDLFGSTRVLLATTRDSVIDEVDCVELGLSCADVCRVLYQGMKEAGVDQPNSPALGAIEQLTRTVAEIQKHIIKRGKRSVLTRPLRAKDYEEAITAWRLELDKIRRIFEIELATPTDDNIPDVLKTYTSVSVPYHDAPNTGASEVGPDVLNAHTVRDDIGGGLVVSPDIHMGNEGNTNDKSRAAYASAPGESPPPLPGSPLVTVTDIHRDGMKTRAMVSEAQRDIQRILESHENTVTTFQNQNSIRGEFPPPPPRVCFGRDALVEKIIDFAENLSPLALIGPGGIGKTSIALTVLHHGRIKERFGENRWFIRCDQFPASRANFLCRLSKVIGAGVENPEDLAPLRSFLSSKEMLIVLDNAESILDPQGVEGQEIHRVVDELSRFTNISLVITSRISTIPSNCESLDIPTLSMEAARDAFYRIYKHSGGRSDSIDSILEQLDFHPLSTTLLATVAHQNRWDNSRLAREWRKCQTGMLRTEHNESLAAAIELSLSSPMFKKLGPAAREVLGVIAFFPQGVNGENLEQLFPIPEQAAVFDKFRILSLTDRNDSGFITMLAPLRDYLRPKDPLSSSLLCAVKEYYFSRMSVELDPYTPEFRQARWIASEDANVERLLDVFTSVDANSDSVWTACISFLCHLHFHKPRRTVLEQKIKALSDDHRSKPGCLYQLSLLFGSARNHTEEKRLLEHALRLERERRNDDRVALTLRNLFDVNRVLGLYEEAIQQGEEAMEIFERVGDMRERAWCSSLLATLFLEDNQPDVAEETAIRTIKLLPEEGEEPGLCELHRTLGCIYRSRGEREKATHHLQTALKIASSFNWDESLSSIHFDLAMLFHDEDELDNAHAHMEQAKLHMVDNTYELGCLLYEHARMYYHQHMLDDATSEALRAFDIFNKLGLTNGSEEHRRHIEYQLGHIRHLLWHAEHSRCISDKSDFSVRGTGSSTEEGSHEGTSYATGPHS